MPVDKEKIAGLAKKIFSRKASEDTRRNDAVTQKILQQDAARQRYESGHPSELPLQSEDWKFALGMAGLSGLSKAIPAVGAELTAYGPLYKQAAKTLLTDIPAFETIDRMPTLWGRGRLTQEVGSGVERGVRAVLPDGKVEDIVAPALGAVAGFAAGIPVGGVSHLMARNAGNVLNATADAANRIMQDNVVRRATSSMLPVEDVYGYGNGAVSSLVEAPAEQAAPTPLYQAYREAIGMPERFANPWVGFRSPSYQYAEPTFNYIEGMTPLQREGVNLGLSPGDPGYVDLDLNRIAAGVNMRRTARQNVEDYISRLSQARWPRDIRPADQSRIRHYDRFLNFNLPETSRNYRPMAVDPRTGVMDDAAAVTARQNAVTRTGRRQEAVRRSYRERAEEDLRLLQRDLADYRQRAGNEIANTGAVSSDTEEALGYIQGEIANAERRVAANAPARSARTASTQPVVSGELATEADIDAFLAEEARNQTLDDAIRQDVAEQAYEFSDVPRSSNGLLQPVQELSDAEFARRATPRQLRLLSSTPSRAEQTRIVNNIMSDVFGSDWRTNPNAFTDSNPIVSQPSRNTSSQMWGNVFADRYGIMPSEFERLLGPTPTGRARSLEDYMQTARNLETEAGGLENLRTMLAEGRLPGQGRTAGAVRTPSASPATSATAQAVSQIPGNNEFIEDMFRQNWGMSVDEGAAFLRGQGLPVNSMDDISRAFRSFEADMGSKQAVRDYIASRAGTTQQAAQSVNPNVAALRAGLRMPSATSNGPIPPGFSMYSAQRTGSANLAEMRAAVPQLTDDELFNAYIAKMRNYIDVPYNHGETYARTYNSDIESDSLFRELAKEMQKRFGSTQGHIPGYEGETFDFGFVPGQEYDKLARWIRFSEDSPYVKNRYQYGLPGDATEFSWFNGSEKGHLGQTGENTGRAAMNFQQSVPPGSAVIERNTSVESEPLKASGALRNYGHGPGQSYVEILRSPDGKPIMGRRNHYGVSNRVNKRKVFEDFKEKLQAYEGSWDTVRAERAKKIAKGEDPNTILDPVLPKELKPFYDHIDNGSLDWLNEFDRYLDTGSSDYKDLFNSYISQRLSKSRANVLKKLSQPMDRISAIEGWTDIPAPYYTDTEEDIMSNLLDAIKYGTDYEYIPQPYSVEHHVIQHDLGGPLLLNPYAGGGPLGNGFPDFMTRNDDTRSYNTGVKAKGLKDRALRKELKEWESGLGAQLIRDSSLVKYINPRDLSISYIPEEIVPKEDNGSRYGHGPAHIDAFTGLDKDSDEFISRLIYVGMDGETGGYIYLDPLTGEQELYDSYLEGAQDEGDLGLYASGGKIHIKPSHRGRFTALLKRTGKSASWFKAHGTPSQKKMATFALNARKWKHADGGPLDNGIDYSGIETTNNRKYNPDYISYIDSALANAKLPDAKRASILANIIEESGGDPFALDSTGKFYGLLQWADDRYSPTGELDPYREIDNQVANIINTLGNTTDGKSWTHGGTGSGYDSYRDAMADFDNEDLATAMKGFTLGYVRPTGKIDSYNNRLKVAQQILDRYNNIPEKKAVTLMDRIKAVFGDDTEAIARLINAAKATSGGFR